MRHAKGWLVSCGNFFHKGHMSSGCQDLTWISGSLVHYIVFLVLVQYPDRSCAIVPLILRGAREFFL